MILILFLNVNYLAVYYSLYILNTESLTESCCVKIVENCNAHCYLDSKMNEESSNSNKGVTVEMKLKLSEFQITEIFKDLNVHSDQKFYNKNSVPNISLYLKDIDHPPQS
jgi:hypothetical protein